LVFIAWAIGIALGYFIRLALSHARPACNHDWVILERYVVRGCCKCGAGDKVEEKV
jgi:hypothetical protein